MQSCLNCYDSFFLQFYLNGSVQLLKKICWEKNEGELAHEYDQISDYNIRARKIRDKKIPGRFYSRIKK